MLRTTAHLLLVTSMLLGSAHGRSESFLGDFKIKDIKNLNSPQEKERKALLQQINPKVDLVEKKLKKVSLELDYLSQSEHYELINRIFSERKSYVFSSGAIGTGLLPLSYNYKKMAADNLSKAPLMSKVQRIASRGIFSAGVALIGSSLYLGFFDRAKIYEQTINELSALSDEEIPLYVVEKMDEYEQLYDHFIRLKEVRDCVASAEQPLNCL